MSEHPSLQIALEKEAKERETVEKALFIKEMDKLAEESLRRVIDEKLRFKEKASLEQISATLEEIQKILADFKAKADRNADTEFEVLTDLKAKLKAI